LILSLPLRLLVTFISVRMFPPDVQMSGDVKGMLYGVPTELTATPQPSLASETIVEPPGGTPAARRTLSTLDRERWTFESVGIALGLTALALIWTWTSFAPVVYRTFPEFLATRRGPRGFPVSVHIGVDTLAFTNGSGSPWSCWVSLGDDRMFTTTLDLDAHETQGVPYDQFRDDAGRTRADLQSVARDRINIRCTDDSNHLYASTLTLISAVR
jgi:hypothetical protein